MFMFQVGKCKLCGCTDNNACVNENGPCSWINEEHDLCSACVSESGESDYPVFNESQMLRFVNVDAYLQWMYNELLKKGHSSEIALEVLFNANVLGDSGMTHEYESYAQKGE